MLTNRAARQIAERAIEAARAIPCAMSIAIVDSGANLLYFERMDDALGGSVETAIRKARSAALFRRQTKAFEDMLAGGRMAVLALPGALPIEGGVPIFIDATPVDATPAGGTFAGAIGVSGGTAQQDGTVAAAGATAALTP